MKMNKNTCALSIICSRYVHIRMLREDNKNNHEHYKQYHVVKHPIIAITYNISIFFCITLNGKLFCNLYKLLVLDI